MSTVRRLGSKLIENAGLKVLSLVFASLLWLVIVSIDNPVMTLPFNSIPINIENADLMKDSGKAFELSDSSKNVSVSVRAERSVLSELSKDNFKATIDMSLLDGNRVPIEVKATKYSDRIQSITPRQQYATVIIDDLKESQYRIRVETEGRPEEGYAIGSTSLASNVVKVSGPESIVSQIDHAAVRVDVSRMTSEIHTTESIVLLNVDGIPVDASTLTMSIKDTYVTVQIWETKEITVRSGVSGTPAYGYAATGIVTIDPAVIEVTGENSKLKELESIVIPGASVDIEGATAPVTQYVNIKSYLPEGIYLTNPERDGEVSVVAQVEALITRELAVPTAGLTFANVPSGMRGTLEGNSDILAVPVAGLTQTLDGINLATLTGTVDLGVIKPGEGGMIIPGVYDCPVTLVLPEGVTQGGINVHVLLQYSGTGAEVSAHQGAGTLSQNVVAAEEAGANTAAGNIEE
ncbi:MAG: hypothetical protein J6O55_06990 [Lachnospiraceae bacterium]|nr:hypothetical protein [Lachnospiraceae bacterium]